MTTPRIDVSDSRSSIYETKDGRWHGKVTVGRKPNGDADIRHRSAPTQREVIRKVRELERQRDSGVVAAVNENTTLGTWLEHWLTHVVAVEKEPKTLASYSSAMRKHVIPVLGAVRLRDVSTETVEKLYASLVHNGARPHTVHAVHRTLSSALAEAVERKRLVLNPVSAAAVAKPEETEVDPLDIAECKRMLACAAEARNGARWGVALALGLRQGEALGLRWADIDLDDGTMRVRRQVQRVTWKHGCGDDAAGVPACGRSRGGSCPARHGGGLLLRKLKTAPSRRDLAIPPTLLAELRKHRQAQLAERLGAPEWKDLDLVFAAPDGGYVDPKHDHDEWHRLREAAGVRPARLHDARHTAATILLILDVHPRTAMEMMGWTDMKTMLRYTHVVSELKQAAAVDVGRALWPTQAD